MPIRIDAARANSIFTGVKVRLDLYSAFGVGEKLAEQLAELAALRNEIAKLKAARGEV